MGRNDRLRVCIHANSNGLICVGEYAEHDRLFIDTVLVPQWFWGSEEKSYLFSGSWGALVII